MSDPRNTARFVHLFPQAGELQTREADDSFFSRIRFARQSEAGDFRQAVNQLYVPVISQMFEDLALLEPHYRACHAAAQWATTAGDTTVQEVWDKVFCGGEGLYWIFRADSGEDARAANYRAAIGRIEATLSEKRAEPFGDAPATVDNVFRTFTSKIFQIGFVMATDYVARITDGDQLKAAQLLTSRLNEYSLSQWTAVMTKLRASVIGATGTVPRAWPAFRNILLRMYDGDRQEIYDADNRDQSPEFRAYSNALDAAAKAIADTQEGIPEDREVKRIARTEFRKIAELGGACGLSAPWFEESEFVKSGVEHLNRQLQTHFAGES
jgi:hypothetical protein